MTDLLGIGRSGVLAYKSALTAVGENVTNAETPGYARRTVRLEEVSGGRTSPFYRPGVTFGGVSAAGVKRAWDDYKAANSRTDAADYGRADARSRWLTTVETALGDGTSGVGQRLTAVFNAADALAADPAGAVPRRQMLLALDNAAASFRSTAAGLSAVGDGVAGEADSEAETVNAALTSLAKVNRELLRATPGSAAAAYAMDERDRLIDQVAGRLEVTVTLSSDRGLATLSVNGQAGQTLVEGVEAKSIRVQRAADGRLSFSLDDLSGARSTLVPTGGTLAGLGEISNIVADRRTTLDGLARDFAATINGWSAAGRDKAGVAGPDLLDLGANGAATLTALAVDPDQVAAADSATVNGNALALASVRGGGGLEDRWSAMIAGNAQTLAAAKSEETASLARKEAAFAARDEVSGIDLDSEAADLLRFQQAYGASAKVIQAARETLQDILNLF